MFRRLLFTSENPPHAGSAQPSPGVGERVWPAALSERLDSASQLSGPLWKRDTSGGDSWTLRRFVLKDAFLLYYAAEAAEGGGGGAEAGGRARELGG